MESKVVITKAAAMARLNQIYAKIEFYKRVRVSKSHSEKRMGEFYLLKDNVIIDAAESLDRWMGEEKCLAPYEQLEDGV